MQFPVYRKYKNGKNYFKITSTATMQELKLVGRYFQVTDFEATIHPDRVMISDLLEAYENFADDITEEEYNDKLSWCRSNMLPLEL